MRFVKGLANYIENMTLTIFFFKRAIVATLKIILEFREVVGGCFLCVSSPNIVFESILETL